MTTVLRILVVAAAFFSGCTNYAPMMSGSPQNPPFPATRSILPLSTGLTWNYSLTAYDSMGNKIVPNRIDLTLSLPGGFGLEDDTRLVELTWDNFQKQFPAYAYKYEWDNRDSGAIVVHRGAYELGKRGLYVIGWYRRTETRLFQKEKLWLAYPADSGKTWIFHPDSSDDGVPADTLEIVSTQAKFFVPDKKSITAGSFYECYLYKETNGPSVSYYYYHPDIGCVGYLRYWNGNLRESYYLKQSGGN
jgi:hypothetical protein